MRFFKTKLLTLVFLLVFSTLGVLYSTEETCHDCWHAHGTGTAGFPTCDGPHWKIEKEEGRADGNCISGEYTTTCEDDTAKLKVDIYTYKCVRYPYRWEAQNSTEYEMDDCTKWDP